MEERAPIIIGLVLLVYGMIYLCLGCNIGKTSIVQEMNKYGSVRIDGKMYVLEEVLNNDK